MKLLIVRHAPAGDRGRWAKKGKSDELRPLTAKGRKKMARAARGLARLAEKMDLLAASPLARARQTARIVRKALGKVKTAEINDLKPEAEPREILRWLQGRREKAIALVGHEPHLGSLISLLCTGLLEPFMTLKKGGACLLEFPGKPRAKGAALAWVLSPGQLRKLAG